MTAIKSPCIGVCSTTLGDDVCRGCGRTFEQIRDWAGYSPEQRQTIMNDLQEPSGLSLPDHLVRACKEIHEWQRTGVLNQNGVVVRRALNLQELTGEYNPRLAESNLLNELVELVALKHQ